MNTDMQQVLDKIDKLISRKGFVYAIIMALLEDESIPISNLGKRNNYDRLCSNEILFLWSLLVNKEDFWQYPDSIDDLYSMRCEIGSLMGELHFTFFTGLITHLRDAMEVQQEEYKPYYDGAAFQEAIFYSGGALYDEEYIYYIKKRFTDDSRWLKEQKGYDKDSFCDIASKIKQVIKAKILRFRFLSLPETWEQLLAEKPSDLTEQDYRKILTIGQFFYNQDEELTLEEFCDRLQDAISFTKEELDEFNDIDSYLQLFSLKPSKGCNDSCKEPGDYSILMSSPIICCSDGHYLLTETHQLFKSLYDVPRYWLNEQTEEHQKIKSHIGDFSEEQTLKVLKSIFGENCYRDIIVLKGKSQITDIDALCVWKDYAICFQIKSKGLTLSSRQGNFDTIRSDFKKSFQAAYNQGVKSRNALLAESGYSFIDKGTGKKISLPTLKEVYIVCETSDEYPSLTHQMAVLLNRKETDPEALAINLFDIDVMGMFLNEPYYFMHYVHNRMKFYGSTRTDVETNCLYAYTDNRLLLSGDEYNAFMFDNSFSKAIDAELLPKYEKHEAITIDNSIWRDATFDALIKEIDSSPQAGLSQVIFNLLNFSKKEAKQIGESINELLKKGADANKEYYSFRKGDFGCTFTVMEIADKMTIHTFIKAISIKEIKRNNAKNWLTIVHFNGTNSLVGSLAYIS